jgi:hypothetical protein
LRELLNTRDAPGLMYAFEAMGVTVNPPVAFQTKKHLLAANFRGKSIDMIKAVIDQVRDVINQRGGVGSAPMPDTELRVIFFDKALQSDTSENKDKYSHVINTIEQEPATARTTYLEVFHKLKSVSIQFDAKNNKGNLVDNTFRLHGLNVNEVAKSTYLPSGKLSCLGCKKEHSIENCHSYYVCQADNSKAHHIRDKCYDPKCVQPKDQLKKCSEHIESQRSGGSQKMGKSNN